MKKKGSFPEQIKYLKQVDSLLTTAVSDAKNDFHQFVLGSNNNGDTELRTVVLRKWSLKRQSILFHTDIRSPKITQLKSCPTFSILFYSKKERLQLRFKASTHIHYQDKVSEYCLNKTTESQKKCCQFSLAPSSEIKDNTKEVYAARTKSKKIDIQHDFSAIVCNFYELDVLFLNHKGQQRLLYKWNKQGQIQTKNLVA